MKRLTVVPVKNKVNSEFSNQTKQFQTYCRLNNNFLETTFMGGFKLGKVLVEIFISKKMRIRSNFIYRYRIE